MMIMRVGDMVTCKEAVPAFYSKYAGNPEVVFRPGMIGTVGAIDVPAVTGPEATYTCVDFKGPASMSTPPNTLWRVALSKDNISRVKTKSVE